jgi:hypothetical protein
MTIITLQAFIIPATRGNCLIYEKGDATNYLQVYPPSITSSLPVTNLDSSLAR